LNRTNEIISIISSEVLTANSTQGVTGSISAPKNSRLIGSFTANTLYSSSIINEGYTSNASHFVFSPSVAVFAAGAAGDSGQVLTTDGSAVYCSNPPGSGTVTLVANGAGLIGGNIRTTGTLSVKAGPGIRVDAAGVSVNTAYISTLATNAKTLLNKNWASPDNIGTTTPATGTFTTASADKYIIRNKDTFLLDSTVLRTAGYIDALTPGTGTTGGFRLRATNSTTNPHAYFQITNSVGDKQIAYVDINKEGNWGWSNTASFKGGISTDGGNIALTNGDLADLGDGYGSLRFSNGVKIYTGNKSGTAAITLNTNGTAYAGDDKFLTLKDFTTNTKSDQTGYTKLPGGIIMAWGVVSVGGDSTASVSFSPSNLFTNLWNVQLTYESDRVGRGTNQDNSSVYGLTNTGFVIANDDGTTRNHYWLAIGN
jgi:hypothetical protein